MVSAILLTIMLPVASAATAGERSRIGYVGLSGGVMGSGTSEINTITTDLSSSLSLGGFVDFAFGEHLHYGLAASYARMTWSVDDSLLIIRDEKKTLIDIAVTFKADLGIRNGAVLIRPGVGVGFAMLSRLSRLYGTNYLSVSAFTQVAVQIRGGTYAMVDAGIWQAPSGGNDDYDITIGPLAYLRLGVMF